MPSCDQLVAYSEWLLQGGLAVATVRNHMAAVKSLYSWMGNRQVLCVLNSTTWSLTVKGLLNTVRPSYNTRTAMTPDDLLAMMEFAYRYDDLQPLSVALAFGFFGYLRISNLDPQTVASFDVTRHTTFGDIHFRNNWLLLSLKWTKTRQANEAFPVPLPMLGSSPLCPFKAWRRYNMALQDVDITPLTPVLLTTQEPVGLPLATSMLRVMFREALSVAGLSDGGYTPHSLRRGGATFSYHAGVPLDQIKRHGTWKSDSVQRYLKDQNNAPVPIVHSFQKLLMDYDY